MLGLRLQTCHTCLNLLILLNQLLFQSLLLLACLSGTSFMHLHLCLQGNRLILRFLLLRSNGFAQSIRFRRAFGVCLGDSLLLLCQLIQRFLQSLTIRFGFSFRNQMLLQSRLVLRRLLDCLVSLLFRCRKLFDDLRNTLLSLLLQTRHTRLHLGVVVGHLLFESRLLLLQSGLLRLSFSCTSLVLRHFCFQRSKLLLGLLLLDRRRLSKCVHL